MKKDLSWKNPYIERVNSIPEILLSGQNNQLSAIQLDQVRQKTQLFSAVFLELGSGSGRHLIQLAQQNSKCLYIGVELRYKRAFKTAEKAKNLGLENLIVLRVNALKSQELFLVGTISGVYVNFPDPWEKNRWKKHRLLSEDSLKWISLILIEGGFLAYKTDHLSYFEDTVKLISSLKSFDLALLIHDLNNNSASQANIQTEFEKLFNSKGLPVYFLKALKKSAD